MAHQGGPATRPGENSNRSPAAHGPRRDEQDAGYKIKEIDSRFFWFVILKVQE
jgi:hypothetical protein